MTSRLPVLWIALQTLLGLWFVWLLCAGSAIAPPRADAADASRPARGEATEVASPSSAGEPPLRELATPAAAVDPARDGVLLYGRITDEQGNPVDKALLSIRQGGEHMGASETGPRGTYSLAGVLPGEADLLVRTAGFRRLNRTLQLAGPSQRHDLVLQRAIVLQVIGRTPAGEPLEAALRAAGIDERIRLRAIATREPPAPLPVDGSGIGVGRFRSARWLGRVQIEGAPDELLGTLEIDGELPVHVTLIVGSAMLGTQVVQPGQQRVEFSLTAEAVRERLARIRLQLVAATTGRPLAAVRVDGPGVKITDAEGVAEFADVIPGQHRLEVSTATHELDQIVQVEPGQQLDLGRLALPESQIVAGVVLDQDGRPVQATLSWDDLDGLTFPQPLRDNRTAGSDAQGRWQLRLTRHRHVVHARTKEGAQQAHLLLDLTAGVPEQISLRLRPTVPVQLQKAFAADRSYLLSIRTGAGAPVFGSLVRAGFEQSIQLPAGDYIADVHEGRTLVHSFGFTVGDTATQIRIP